MSASPAGASSAVGDVAEPARRTIDADGRWSARVHRHPHALRRPVAVGPDGQPVGAARGDHASSGGNCGFSIAPSAAGDADYVQAMMAVVEGIPLGALARSGAWDWTYLRRVPRPPRFRASPSTPGSWSGIPTVRRAVMGEDATRSEAATRRNSPPWWSWSRTRWPAAHWGSRRLWARGTPTARADPVPRVRRPTRSSWPWPVRCATYPGTTLEFIPAVGPIDEDRMRPDGRHVTGGQSAAQLESSGQPGLGEIYEQQLGRPTWPPRRGAHVVALTLPDMMRMRATHVLRRPSRLARGREPRSATPARRGRRCRPARRTACRSRKGGAAVPRGAQRLRAHGDFEPESTL